MIFHCWGKEAKGHYVRVTNLDQKHHHNLGGGQSFSSGGHSPLPLAGYGPASNAGGLGRNRYSEHMALVPAVSAATGQVLSTGSPVDHGHRIASYDTLLVVTVVLIAGEDDERLMTRSLNVTPKTLAEQCI